MVVKEKVTREVIKTAVGYVRVSTEGQAKDDKYGIEAQKQAITKYAKENGYTIVDWVEEHESGAHYERAGWCNKILYNDKVRSPEVDAVIVFKNDRITRGQEGMKMYFFYLYLLEKKGVKLISTVEDFDGQGDLANIYRAIMSFVAEQERQNIIMRTENGKLVKAQKGGFCGGKNPYGYVICNKQLVIDPHEATIVKTIFELDKQGYNHSQICRELTKNGYKTRVGTNFCTGTLFNILNNKLFYAGYYSYGDVLYEEGAHEPILPRTEAIEKEVRYKKMKAQEARRKKAGCEEV